MRLIDADAIEYYNETNEYISSTKIAVATETGYIEYSEPVQIVNKETIDAMPTVEPKRKTGKWIHEGWEASYLRCSACGYRDYTEEHNNFCPNCGADMRGEQDE